MERGGGWAGKQNSYHITGSRLVPVSTRSMQPCRWQQELLLVPFGREVRQRVALVAPPLTAFIFIFSLLEQSALCSCVAFSLSSSVLDRSHLTDQPSVGGTRARNVRESAVTSQIVDRSSVIGLERIQRFVRVCDQKGIREIRDVKIARVKIDEDAKDSTNPFGSRSRGSGNSIQASLTLGLSTIKSSH